MKRFELHLSDCDIEKLDKVAKAENRSRKNYCEHVIMSAVLFYKFQKRLKKKI
jgi:hypothetical protein